MSRDQLGGKGGAVDITALLVERIHDISAVQDQTAKILVDMSTRITRVESELIVRVPGAEREHAEFRAAIADLTRLVNDHEGMLKWGRWGIGAAVVACLGFLALIPVLWRIGSALAVHNP